MSGHSKWHNIQQRKGKQDAKRGDTFSKYSKLITVSARMGGGDPEANFSLRMAIEKAKKEGVPKDNIDKAIKSGTGDSKDVAQIEEMIYEGYGPGGVAILVKCLTDNKNRAVSEVKNILSKSGGSMAGAGSVMWMFERKGVVRLEEEKLGGKSIDQDDFELNIIEAGAEDLSKEDGIIEIICKLEDLQNILKAVEEMELEIESSGLEYIAKDKVEVEKNVEEKIIKLFDTLENSDDVDEVFTNAV